MRRADALLRWAADLGRLPARRRVLRGTGVRIRRRESLGMREIRA